MEPSARGKGKKGFRLKALPEDAYRGQQERLKKDLIQRAKLKKKYAQVLKKESTNEDVKSSLDRSGSVRNAEVPTVQSITEQEAPTMDAPGDTPMPYRQRMKARKADPSASGAALIKAERKRESELSAHKKLQIEQKRLNRMDIKHRETSRTKKGQPLMKDRMKNILDKLQSAT